MERNGGNRLRDHLGLMASVGLLSIYIQYIVAAVDHAAAKAG